MDSTAATRLSAGNEMPLAHGHRTHGAVTQMTDHIIVIPPRPHLDTLGVRICRHGAAMRL